MMFEDDPLLRERLKEKALRYREELSNHPVLKKHWDRLSLVLKGSTAHGYSDRYSDVDLVLFCDESVFQEAVAEYHRLGLTSRTDGVFLPIDQWNGHYNLDTLSALRDYFQKNEWDFLWEYGGSAALHDPGGQFQNAVQEGARLFQDRLDDSIFRHYLQCQLDLNWLQQPLHRADTSAALLYTARIYRMAGRLTFLLAGRPYPCDKWLPYFLSQEDIPGPWKPALLSYPELFASAAALTPHLDLMEYPLYAAAHQILVSIIAALTDRYGECAWITNWSDYA